MKTPSFLAPWENPAKTKRSNNFLTVRDRLKSSTADQYKIGIEKLIGDIISNLERPLRLNSALSHQEFYAETANIIVKRL
jgi:hypothetical protein